MRKYYIWMILMNAAIVGLIVYNLYSMSTEDYVPANDYAEFYDLGCDDSELVPAGNTSTMICREIGALCEIACQNLSDVEVQASMGKGNTVTCRCYRPG